jgi:hypothetical protein
VATAPRTHRDTALVVMAIAGGAAWLAVPIAVALDGASSVATIAMIAGCGLGALVAVTVARMTLVTAGVAGAVAALLLQGVLVAWGTHTFALDAEHLRIAGLSGLVAAAAAFAGSRRRGAPLLMTTSALVVFGASTLVWTGGALWLELTSPAHDLVHAAIAAFVIGAPVVGGMVCGLLVPGSNTGHVALAWLGLVIGMTLAIALAARTPLAIGPGLLSVLILVPFLSGLSAFGLWIVKRRPDPPADVLPEARTL